MKNFVFILKNSLTVRCEAGFTELRGGPGLSDWGEGGGVRDIGLPLRRRRRRRKELFTTICQKNRRRIVELQQ